MELREEVALLKEKVALMERLVELERQLQSKPTFVPCPMPQYPPWPTWPQITWTTTSGYAQVNID